MMISRKFKYSKELKKLYAGILSLQNSEKCLSLKRDTI